MYKHHCGQTKWQKTHTPLTIYNATSVNAQQELCGGKCNWVLHSFPLLHHLGEVILHIFK